MSEMRIVGMEIDRQQKQSGGKTVTGGTLHYEDGRKQSGVLKAVECEDQSGCQGVEKEVAILRRLATRVDLKAPQILDERDLRSVYPDRPGRLILRSLVPGVTLTQKTRPLPLSEVRQKSGNVFDSLAFVAGQDDLVSQGRGFCGDISTGNLVDTGEDYVLIDWEGTFGRSGAADVTLRYAAPEVLDADAEVNDVNADTFSLGCVLARLLMGKPEFDRVALGKPDQQTLNFTKVESRVPEETRDFFKIALAEDPFDRVPTGVANAVSHYQVLKEMFRGGR